YNRLSTAFNELFTDEEIKELHSLMQTKAFDKLFSNNFQEVLALQFKDIDQAIETLSDSFRDKAEKPSKFVPIPVDREDGWYKTIGGSHLTEDRDIKLELQPSLTPKDIKEIEKSHRHIDNQPEMSMI